MLRRLRIKFVAVIMAMAAILLCLVFGLVYRSTQAGLERESVAMMQAAADSFRPGRPGGPPGQARLPCFILQTGPQGEIIASGDGFFDLSDQEFLRALMEACAGQEASTGLLKEYGLRFCRADTPMGPRVVFADATGEQAALRSLARSCAVIGVVCFGAFLGLSVLFAAWAVRPVERAWAQQRQFVADASHELKTPLTVIITNAELLQGPGWGEGERARFADNILTMSRQMRSLVERLLELARADGGQAAPALNTVDLSALLDSALLPFEPLFFERGLKLSGAITPGITVQGDGAQLRQAADILLDNAQKYSAPGGRVEVALNRVGRRRCRLSVSSPGEALSRAELKDVFKRFYRADKARSREGGAGLGLSIAQGIVERHHGRIWAESGGGRNTFYVELPAGGARTEGRKAPRAP